MNLKKIILGLILIMLFVLAGCVQQEPQEPIIGGDKDEHGCIGSAGYVWCEAKEKCLREWKEPCVEQTTPDTPLPKPVGGELQTECEVAGGHYNECGSRCQIDNQGKEGIACTMQCEQLCECGGKGNWNCPDKQACKTPLGIKNALGYCVSEKSIIAEHPVENLITVAECEALEGRVLNVMAGAICEGNETQIGYMDKFISPNVCCVPDQEELCRKEGTVLSMDFVEAITIATKSDCAPEGKLSDVEVYCNKVTGTIWIENIPIEKEGCSPACVVKVEEKTAEINYKCTGLIIE